MELVHIYPSTNSYGGIETYIKAQIDSGRINGYKTSCRSVSSRTSKNIHIFHSLLPSVIIKLLRYHALSNKKCIFVAHFHPPAFSKRPVRFRIYLTIIGWIFSFLRLNQLASAVVHTEKELLELNKYFNFKSTYVIPWGIADPILKNKKSLTFKKYDFLYICRADKIKRVELFFKVAKKLSHLNFVLVCPDVKSTACPANIKLIKEISEKSKIKLIQQSKFYFSTSQYESLGLSLAEAEIQGIPAVCSKNSGYIDAVMHNDQAFLVYNDDQEINNKLTTLISLEAMDYAYLSNRAINRAMKITYQNQWQKFESIYEKNYCYNNNIQ